MPGLEEDLGLLLLIYRFVEKESRWQGIARRLILDAPLGSIVAAAHGGPRLVVLSN
jgi:hypothetical protein